MRPSVLAFSFSEKQHLIFKQQHTSQSCSEQAAWLGEIQPQLFCSKEVLLIHFYSKH